MQPTSATRSRPVVAAFAAACCAALGAGPGAAQDVEMLGRHYGTRVPAAYYETLARDPDAFRFSRGRPERVRRRMEAEAAAGRTGAAMVLGPRDGPVTGTFTVPVLLGLYADSPTAQRYDAATFGTEWFGPEGLTVRTYYEEVSGGRVSLRGDVLPWVKSVDPLHTSRWVTNGSSGLQARTPLWIKGLLAATSGVDWAAFDNDGPDGIPNSGDDDGFVDALAVVHPTEGAECRNSGSDDRMWSHKWSMQGPTGSAFTTDVPAAGGGFIRIDDYFIVGQLSCGALGLNEIGVVTHEAGHAFGLPDLYDTRGSGARHTGAGNWELMATGSWGCDNASPALPCHMGAWSKAVLGWAEVVDVTAGSDRGTVRLPPVETSGVIYRVESADGSGEYFLLENRQRLGFDANLRAPGLLVWQIDPDWVAAYWPRNSVNASDHMGVWLRQADGFNELGNTQAPNRGDEGDPFPYKDANAFHAASTPGSVAFEGTATGVTLVDIRRVGADIEFRLLNRLSRVTLRTSGEVADGHVFTVDGVSQDADAPSFLSAPFQRRAVEAAPGAPLGPGVRVGFQGWVDRGDDGRVFQLTTPMEDVLLTAHYAGRQVELAVDVRGGVNGVLPGSFRTMPEAPDLWFAEGTEITVEARPTTGFAFVDWSGVLAGQPNPATVVMNEPLSAGADFEVTYEARSASVDLEAADRQEIQLEVLNANQPVTWLRVDGRLPQGLLMQSSGLITGAAMETGSFALTLEVRDALGLTDRATLDVRVVEPQLPVSVVASPFLLVGQAMTLEQQIYLDRKGNGNGDYDLGDLRAWILAHPDLPLTAAVRALVGDLERRTVVVGGRQGGGS